jgi:hypothetical protein
MMGDAKPDVRMWRRSAVARNPSSAREIDSFECAACGVTMKSWNTAWMPAYRLIIGPVRKPDQS